MVRVLALVLGFWLGVGFWGWGVWWVEVFGWWVPVLGWWAARRVGVVPLRPLLKSCPHLLGGLWFLVRVAPLLAGGVCWLVAVCGVQFSFEGVGWACGWLVLLVVFRLGCSQPGVVVAVLVGRLGSSACLLGVLCGCGLCGLCPCRGVVLRLAVLFPLGGPTWTVGLFVAPLFLPPHYTTETPRP